MSITVRRSVIISLGDKGRVLIEEGIGDGYTIDIQPSRFAEHKIWIGMPHKDGKHYPFWDDVVDEHCKQQGLDR